MYIKSNNFKKRDLEPFSPATAHSSVMTNRDFRAMSNLCSDSTQKFEPGLLHTCCRVPSRGRSFLGLALWFQSNQLHFDERVSVSQSGLKPGLPGDRLVWSPGLVLFRRIVDLAWRELVEMTEAELGTETYCWVPGHLLFPSPWKGKECIWHAQLPSGLVWG